MHNNEFLLPVKSDFVFKLIFGDQRNIDILAAFLKSMIDLSDDEYDRLTIIDPYIKKESEDDKYGILDIKIQTTNGNIIHVEIQIKNNQEIKTRTIYSQSKLITEQLSTGMSWSMINRVITILILDGVLITEGKKYYNEFCYRTKDGIEFTNLVQIITLDLRKLPQNDDNTDLWCWMKFIKSDDEEGLNMLVQKNPHIKKAVGILKELSADERNRMLYEKREMARMDFESMRDYAVREKAELIAKNALKKKIAINDIADITGLSIKTIENIRDSE